MPGRRMSVVFLLPVLATSLLSGQAADPAPEHPLALSAEMESFLAENIDLRARPMDRLRQLVGVVFNDNILGFTYQGVTRTAIQTFQTRRGNCLSFTMMFIAMARQAGLDVQFREVETIPIWNQRGRVFSVSSHINVAVNMGARWFLVDLFPDIGRLEVSGRVVSDERGLAHFYNNRAVDRLAAGQNVQAIRYLERALELDPEAAFAWTGMGVARSQQGELEAAETAYLRAVKLKRDNLPAISNLATLYNRMGRPDKARRYRGRAQRFRRKNPYYHYGLGERALEAGKTEEAIGYYRKAIDLKKQEHRFHFALACAYSRLGETDKALKHLEKAGRYAPDESGRLRYHQKMELLEAHRAQTIAGLRP